MDRAPRLLSCDNSHGSFLAYPVQHFLRRPHVLEIGAAYCIPVAPITFRVADELKSSINRAIMLNHS